MTIKWTIDSEKVAATRALLHTDRPNRKRKALAQSGRNSRDQKLFMVRQPYNLPLFASLPLLYLSFVPSMPYSK